MPKSTLKLPTRRLQTFFCEDHRFGLAHGLADVTLGVQAFHHVPVKAFSGTVALVQAPLQQLLIRHAEV